MTEMTRHCPGCGHRSLFEQHHADGSCPDSPDGDCPEWACTSCGEALLIGFAPCPRDVTRVQWRRVA
jgi:hypothetical protein